VAKVCTVSVVNWETYQQYKDRSPKWIKVHNSFLEDPAVAALPDAAKGHLLGIWLLASRLDNRIPGDSAFIAKRINATSKVDLSLFLRMSFLEWSCGCLTHGANPYALAQRSANPYTEERRGEEIRGEEKRGSDRLSSDAQEVFEHWKAVMEHPESRFTANRREAVTDRLKEGYTVEQLKRAVSGCRASDFHRGKNDRGAVYDDLELICRSGEKVENFMAMSAVEKSDLGLPTRAAFDDAESA
jgi:hypothetical protein